LGLAIMYKFIDRKKLKPIRLRKKITCSITPSYLRITSDEETNETVLVAIENTRATTVEGFHLRASFPQCVRYKTEWEGRWESGEFSKEFSVESRSRRAFTFFLKYVGEKRASEVIFVELKTPFGQDKREIKLDMLP